MKALRFLPPSADTLERIALAGRARARRVSAQALNDALDGGYKRVVSGLLKHDFAFDRCRQVRLRMPPHSSPAVSMHALLERLPLGRAIRLPLDLTGTIRPARRAKFAREGTVAPLTLPNDFGEYCSISSLAALISEVDTVLGDAGMAPFDRRAPCCPGPTRRHAHGRTIFPYMRSVTSGLPFSIARINTDPGLPVLPFFLSGAIVQIYTTSAQPFANTPKNAERASVVERRAARRHRGRASLRFPLTEPTYSAPCKLPRPTMS